jgi:hypothetical protein
MDALSARALENARMTGVIFGSSHALDSKPVAQLGATLASASACILLQCDSVPQTSFNFSLPHLAVH